MKEQYPSPLPLWPTPWPLSIFWPWRWIGADGRWRYISHREYRRLFGRKAS